MLLGNHESTVRYVMILQVGAVGLQKTRLIQERSKDGLKLLWLLTAQNGKGYQGLPVLPLPQKEALYILP